MTTDLDRLELELRCIPGVVAVGLDRDSDGRGLLVQAVVVASEAAPDLRSRVRRVVDSNVREPVSLEIIVDMAESPATTTPTSLSIPPDEAPK